MVATSAGAAEPANHWVRRVNSGGPVFLDSYGKTFAADQGYTAGGWGFVGGQTGSTSNPVAGTADDPLYQTARGGNDFSYFFDGAPAGTYEVRLYFDEWLMDRSGQRVFHVWAENKLELFRFDPFLYCGSPNSKGQIGVGTDRACVQTFEVPVNDGQVTLRWTRALDTAGIPVVSAIEVSQTHALPAASYVEVAQQVGIVHSNVNSNECPQSVSTGSAWADYDGDDDIDLYVTNHGGANRLYQNQGGTGLPSFVDVAVTAGVDDPLGYGHGAVFIDYDNDGDQDLYVTNLGANILFENQLVETGTAWFVDVTATAGIGNIGRSVTGAWADYDGDSDLDLYVTNHFECMEPPFTMKNSEDALYRNEGDGSFTDVTGFLCPGGVAPCAATDGLGFSAVWVDYDDDGDVDLYLANDNVDQGFHHNVLWRNDGPGAGNQWLFTDVSVSSGTNSNVNAMGLSAGDFDNDRDMDLAFSNAAPNNLLRNEGNGTFTDVSAGAGIQRGYVKGIPFVAPANTIENFSWGTAFFDHDNDGWLDLLYVNGYLNDDRPLLPAAFFANNRNGTFRNVSATSGLDPLGRVRNASIADVDEDGFPDVFMNNYPDRGLGPFKSFGAFWLFHNQGASMGNNNHWIKVTVQGTTDNRDGIGTRIWTRNTDGVVQMRDINSGSTHGSGDQRAAHFGLGPSISKIHLRIRWPNGTVQWLYNQPVDQHIHVVQGAP
jgi:hypothetical protein